MHVFHVPFSKLLRWFLSAYCVPFKEKARRVSEELVSFLQDYEEEVDIRNFLR